MKTIVKRSGNDKSAQWDCGFCLSTIESTKDEGEAFISDREGVAIGFKCPECNQENWVNAGKFEKRD